MSKGLRVFGHPLHAILSDLPVGLLGTSLLWDAVAVFRGESIWWAISFWSITLGLLAAMMAATAGAVDYAAIKQQDPALADANKHMLYVLAAVVPYILSLLVRGGASAPESGKTVVVIFGLEGLGALLLSVGGWYGGHLVFHHGIGRDDELAKTKS
ncbi:MAG TPA: DUF2231 domain-containing protein [Pyrinomonadaceae bacterium]|nr:DUF2231 domain-containing protein [Pyrinomonadaceae bacterium]